MIIKLTGTQSILKHSFRFGFLADEYQIALISFYSTNLIHNVTIKNNKFYFKDTVHSIPNGQYDINSIKNYFQKNFKVNIKENEINNRITFEDPSQINHEKEDNICKLLGYPDSIPKFIPVETINVHCNLASGQIISDEFHLETDIISTIKMSGTYFKQPIIHEVLRPIYFPVQHKQIQSIEITITDENNNLINFEGAQITIILELRKVNN